MKSAILKFFKRKKKAKEITRLLTPSLIAREAAFLLYENLTIGKSIKSAVGLPLDDIPTTSKHLTIRWISCKADLFLPLQEYSKRYLKPMTERLAKEIDLDLKEEFCKHGKSLFLANAPKAFIDGTSFQALEKYKGFSVMIIETYDLDTDTDIICLDVFYGTKLLNPKQIEEFDKMEEMSKNLKPAII